jgi:gag-polypeptide of LTR copia-type
MTNSIIPSIFGIEKFDEKQNFASWQELICDVLVLQDLDDALSSTKPTKMEDNKWKILCRKALGTIWFCLSNKIKAHFMTETCPNELWMKLEGTYLSKSLASRTALKKLLYRLRIEEGMDLRVHLGAFNTLVRDVFNVGGKIKEEVQACLFMTSLPKSYDPITIFLLGKKGDLTMSEVIIVLLDYESLRQREEDVLGSSVRLLLYQIGSDEKGRAAVHAISAASPVTLDGIVLRDN